MFRPYVGEIITGKLLETHANKIRLTLGFFDDIYVHSDGLPQPLEVKDDSKKPEQKILVWKHSDEGKFTIEGDEICFRVITVDYPSIPLKQREVSKPFAPMVITGDICMADLGPADWWV